MKSAATRATLEGPAQPIIKDPFDVIPIQPENVELKRDSHGMIHLRVTHQPPKGFGATVARWLRYDYSHKVELDEYGTFYYSLIDGASTLRAITERMADKLGKPVQETREMVILYTKKLMTINMIMLKVPMQAGEETR